MSMISTCLSQQICHEHRIIFVEPLLRLIVGMKVVVAVVVMMVELGVGGYARVNL